MLRGKLFPRDLRRGFICQRMPDIADLHSVPRIELLLKGEDHDHLADIFFDLLHAPGAPRPDLRANEIKDWDAKAMQLARQTQIEVWEVDQDGCVGLAAGGFCHQMLEAAANVREVL